MALRLGPGPVFVYEAIAAARRWQLFALRSVFLLLLLTAFLIVWWADRDHYPYTTRLSRLTEVGAQFFYAVMGTQLALILLVAPAATAGSVCFDKARGALLHLLVTDLTNSEIILGKLAARLAPVLGLVAATLPVLFLGALLGGIDPDALIGATLISIGLAVLGCSLALALSVWGTRTHEVLLGSYLVLIVGLLFSPTWWMLERELSLPSVPQEVLTANPFWLAFAPYNHPGATDLTEPCVFLGGTLLLSALLIALAVWRVRAVAVRQASQGVTRPRRGASSWRGGDRLLGPALDPNPVLWREWHRRRASLWMRIGWWLYIALGIIFVLIGFFSHTGGGNGFLAMVNAFVYTIGLLLACVSAVTAVAEERASGSLEVLLTTPLSTSAIVWGKWWGAFRVVPLLAILPTLSVAVAGINNGRIGEAMVIPVLALAYGAAFISLGLALATWIVRVSRALAVQIVIFIVLNGGWLFLALALFHNNLGEEVGMASPWFGIGQMTYNTTSGRNSSHTDSQLLWAFGWAMVYLVAAALLQLVTLRIFDRCLGRAQETAGTQAARRAYFRPPGP